jgi:signal transduction histidine kinase/putative methionine-R-sulfoxide reductase with GAF domain
MTSFDPPRSRLCEFLREHQHEIVADWTRRMRVLSPTRGLPESAIVDHLPQILMRISDMVGSVHTGNTVVLGNLGREHALDRLGRGFNLDQIVTEFALLRQAINEIWQSRVGPTIDVGELTRLDLAFNETIRQSVVRYAEAREKLLKAVDRISEAALGSDDLEAFLKSLLAATLDSTEAADTAVVLLREGERLCVRAAVGLEEELHIGWAVRIGEGFPGHVAAEGRPVHIREAATDPRVISPVVRSKGVRAMYGVPMVRDAKTIGVAHIGSLTASEFSEEDKLLFRTMVSRATSVVVQAQLVADLRRAETAQRFLSEASRQLAESLDHHTTLGRIAHLAVPAIADWCVVDLVDNGTTTPVSVVHQDPSKVALAQELRTRYPTDLNADTGIARVVRTDRSEWQPEITAEHLSAAARDAEHLRMLREIGMKSYVVAPIASRDQVFGTVALVTAESRRRYSESDVMLAEDLARRIGTAIENAGLYTEAQNAVQLRERVLAVVSHDLRNQLGVIAGNAFMLARQAALSEANDVFIKPLDTIQRTAASMERLVGDLLDLAAIQHGRLSLNASRRELKPIVVESCDSYEPIARARGLHLHAHLPIDGVEVVCDRSRILQVLGNLLGNAIKFCEPGDRVTLAAETSGGEVTVAVQDTGPGIRSDQMRRIFEPYKTVERQSRSGTGLGLYITRGIVETHGGRLWVESEPGAGTSFFFTLPRA